LKKFKALCPLIGFQIPWGMLISPRDRPDEETGQIFKERREKAVKGIEIVDGVKVKYISKEDLEDLKHEPYLSLVFPHGMRGLVSRNTFVLEKTLSAKERHTFEASDVMQSIVLAMRLLKGGQVFGNVVLYIRLSEKRGLVSLSHHQNLNPQGVRGGDYSLDFKEIPDLKKLVKKLQKIDFSKRKSLHLACKRFQRTYEEGNSEDPLIDLMIAFEALFLRGKKSVSQRSETIAVACSMLLGKNEGEREEIRNSLKKAYSIRNSIVHGSEHKEGLDLYEFVEQIEGYLRESIKKLLD